jgi:hypothetical protein
MQNAMVDIETLGVSFDSVFLSIAVVQFDINTGTLGKEFYKKITLDSAQKQGRKINSRTLKWWLEQKPELLQEMFKDTDSIQNVMYALYAFFKDNDIVYPWGNSASFDLGMVGNAFDANGLMRPWSFSNERCYRTIVGSFRDMVADIPKPENAHHPLEDCYYQIKKLCAILKVINKRI